VRRIAVAVVAEPPLLPLLVRRVLLHIVLLVS
jgi:hypothetical protein